MPDIQRDDLLRLQFLPRCGLAGFRVGIIGVYVNSNKNRLVCWRLKDAHLLHGCAELGMSIDVK